MRFSIRYVTDYRYESPVEDNLNVLRVTPATTETQRCEDFTLRVEPTARLGRFRDYFGTEVIEVGVVPPHEHLTLEARARVSTTAPPGAVEGPFDAVEEKAYREAGAEFLFVADPPPSHELFEELSSETRAESPLATLRRLVEVVAARFEYRPGSTYVGSTVDDLLSGEAGVCQDFVHLSLMLLRRHGIAARYVSGYLFAAPEGDGAESVEVATHAWLEALLPAADSGGPPTWVGADPTNRRLTGEEYVRIGHGRDYSDLPPIKGMYRGTASGRMDAKVTMTRIDPDGGQPEGSTAS